MLLDRFEMKDLAVKVVGVGSVGTFYGIVLLMAAENDPLFLQIKEANASVLEPYAGNSIHPKPWRESRKRLPADAVCQRSFSRSHGKLGRHFYVRQLKDMKIKIMVELFGLTDMMQYADICGFTLARAHARSGESALISGYLGQSDSFDKAIAAFSDCVRRSK